MKKKDVIKLIIICLFFLIVFTFVMFVILKDRIQIPFESDKLTRLVDIYETKNITPTDNITKIEVLLKNKKNEFTSEENIEQIVSFLETVEGYRISISKVHLTSDEYAVLIYCADGEPVKIRLSPTDFCVEKDNAYENKYYKNAKNYYVLMENLIKELN